VESLAQKLQDNLQNKQQVVIDPATIMLIVTLTNVLIQVIKKCREKPEEAVLVAQYPNIREKRVLKRKILQTIGIRRYISEGKKYYHAVLATGRETTIKDLEDAYGKVGRRRTWL
jgi:hypothetical protein